MRPKFFTARRLLAALSVTAVTIGVMIAAPAAATAAPSNASSTSPAAHAEIKPAADLSRFRPGNIISDAVFLDSSTMSVSEIDSFFRSKVSSCRSGYVCLKDFRQSTVNRPADRYCNGYSGAPNESAASIIHKVALSCGINPQVFIVMLQKEQGLITHTWPSDWRYNAALGQGCPDDAPCDPQFVGFFHQIYGAGRQMKIYMEGVYFQWFAPGNTWNIQYHPERACGTGPVYIENKATAALYYYTPYQPNRAAIAAGYGEGDGCSSYGNRNFYQYFTDWFGDTQSPASRLVKASNADEIYLVVERRKHHITNGTDLAGFMAKLGWYQTVSPDYVSSLPTGPAATRFLRDPRDGGMYLLEPDGSKHHFKTAEHVTRFGFNMAAYTTVPGGLIDRFPTGIAVGDYFRSSDSDAFFRWEGGAKRHIVNPQAWAEIPSSERGYVATLPAANAGGIRAGAAILPSKTLVQEIGAPEVYIAGKGSEIVHIPTWGIAHDAGISRIVAVDPGALANNPRVPGGMSAFVSCDSALYAVDGGSLTRIRTQPSGVKVTALPASICSILPQSGRTISEAVFAKSPSADPVYLIAGTELRHVRSQQRLQEANAGRALTFLSWSADTQSSFTPGAPLLADGSFATFGSAETYYVDNGTLRHVQSVETLINLARPHWPRVEQFPAAWLTAYSIGSPIP